MEKRPIRITEEQIEEQKLFMDQVKNLPNKPQSFHVVTYGCQMNAHDSEYLSGMLLQMGISESVERESADFVIFNTCCVRDNAERRALGNVTWLKEIRKRNPNLVIAVCGCMIQQPGMAEKILKQYQFIDLAFGTSNLYRLPELLYQTLTEDHSVVVVDDQDVVPENMPVKRLRHESAYITIMYGCDNFCSYCVVPYVRGRERSRNAEDILREAELLQKDGVKQIMLLGQNVNSYGKGNCDSINFAQLLYKLDQIGIPRIRFMTSHPKDLSDELIEVMASGQHILPQFHLPVQSGNDEILARMNRHYDRARYLDRVKKLRDAVPGIGLTTDIIVAFPGETEAQFQDTVSLVQEVGYDSAYTFIYSPRNGTKAAAFPDQIPDDIATDRIQRLIAVQEETQRKMMARFLSQDDQVLVEGLSKRSELAVSGKSKHGVSVTLPGTCEDIGHIIPVHITGLKNNTLTGERIEYGR